MSFIVSGLTFKYLIHFDFIFVYGVRECSNSILLYVAFQFPSTTYWRDSHFSIVYPCFICHILNDHNFGSSLDCLSYSIDLYFCFCASTILLWWLWLCSIVWSQGAWFLQLCFPISRLLGYLGSFVSDLWKFFHLNNVSFP